MVTFDELVRNINVLLADDDLDYLTMTYEFLKQLGYNVTKVTDGEAALDELKTDKYQIALLDYFMPGLNGEEVITEIRKTNQELIIILQTGFSGQKPPIDMMKKLNIQNYYDKTEGISRLNLELMSAVKIFNQQNEIEISKYRTNAIGSLITGVAQEIKSNLLAIGAGIEVTNMLVQSATDLIEKQNLEKLSGFYSRNKESLEKIDKVLTSIIGQTQHNSDYIMPDRDIIDIVGLIIKNESKVRNVPFSTKISLKENSYLNGSINDTILIICEIVIQLMKIPGQTSKIDLMLTEDENNWYFDIVNEKITELNKSNMYLIKKIILSVKNLDIVEKENKIQLVMKKEVI